MSFREVKAEVPLALRVRQLLGQKIRSHAQNLHRQYSVLFEIAKQLDNPQEKPAPSKVVTIVRPSGLNAD